MALKSTIKAVSRVNPMRFLCFIFVSSLCQDSALLRSLIARPAIHALPSFHLRRSGSPPSSVVSRGVAWLHLCPLGLWLGFDDHLGGLTTIYVTWEPAYCGWYQAPPQFW